MFSKSTLSLLNLGEIFGPTYLPGIVYLLGLGRAILSYSFDAIYIFLTKVVVEFDFFYSFRVLIYSFFSDISLIISEYLLVPRAR